MEIENHIYVLCFPRPNLCDKIQYSGSFYRIREAKEETLTKEAKEAIQAFNCENSSRVNYSLVTVNVPP